METVSTNSIVQNSEKSIVDDGRLLYWDKKMSQSLFETPGLQLPDNLNAIDSNTIIRKIPKSQQVMTRFIILVVKRKTL